MFAFPQTKGLSLEQIDLMYQNTTPVNSLAYRRRLMADGNLPADEKAAVHQEERSEDEKV